MKSPIQFVKVPVESTEDRLLSDAIKAATSWQEDAYAWKCEAIFLREEWRQAKRRFPIFFIAGMLFALLGILLAAQVFTN